MDKRTPQTFLAAIVGSVLIGMTGCCTVCRENNQAGLARILCQPLDLNVTNDVALFQVTATGRQLSYQWLSNDVPVDADSAKFSGVHSNRLIISNVTEDDVGFYACEIYSIDDRGAPMSTRTRPAALGWSPSEHPKTPGGTPTTNPMPPGTHVKNDCGDFCGLICFHGPFYPKGAGKKQCLLSLTVNHGDAWQTSSYRVFWYDSHGATSCVSNHEATRWILPIQQNTDYAFTVYFPADCPRKGSKVTLFCDWQ